MTDRISLWIPGRPVPKARPRVTQGGSHTYNPARNQNWMLAARAEAVSAMNTARLMLRDGPVIISAVFYLEGRLDEKPDVGNLLANLLDALTGACYQDDAQVVRVATSKQPPLHCGEGTAVTIRWLAN